ncbi:MAG: hypothetical protein H6765_09535 [Candidatus Peribacteria bacterium]|nr:MAG: hypothetical protein H6765_09535 [Candidatus Peribacteria bacterium]
MHELPRFSEDLDFDNTGLSFDEFQASINFLIQQLETV